VVAERVAGLQTERQRLLGAGVQAGLLLLRGVAQKPRDDSGERGLIIAA